MNVPILVVLDNVDIKLNLLKENLVPVLKIRQHAICILQAIKSKKSMENASHNYYIKQSFK